MAKKPGEEEIGLTAPLRRRNPNTYTRALSTTDWEGHAPLRSGGQQQRTVKRIRTPRPQNQHHQRNHTNDPLRVSRERQEAAAYCWVRDRTSQQESLLKQTKKDPKQKNKNPMSPDRAGNSQATATTASKTSAHFREHKEEDKKPRKSD